MQFIKRTVLVTGASSGIGRAIARLLLQQGHQIIGTARDCRKFTHAMPHFTPVALDLSYPELIPEQAAAIERQFPDLDAVIFNAGRGQFGSLEEFSYPQINNLMTVNFTSQVVLTKALLPGFKRKGLGDLVYIGSEAALKGSRKGSIYCASKFALRGFTQALREECSKANIRVCLINPGMVKTPFFEGLTFEPGDEPSQYLLPEDVADVVSSVLMARQFTVIDEINLNPLNRVIRFKKS